MNLSEKLQHYRINEQEYAQIEKILGRPPEGLEWPVFSALWSEHCSYKSSKVHLKKFFSKNDRVLESFGENAGVIDLGEGERVAFKMESHNHPSFIEPYEGAATGVGGILRDIFTMGARPVALANYLCFGEPSADRMEALVDGVVRGIGGYGNCVGVPTITGQTEFHSSYNGNILVNAFALGLFRQGEKVFTASASGVGNYVVYVGAKTGKDGVHGASMASESFDEDSESKKPTIQKGDPFFEKLLIESCIEVMNAGLVEGIQDMGAAGLTSSSFEMAAKGRVGFQLHLDKVPVRDSSITPEEILLSESQERMLLICKPENYSALQARFHHWDLDAEVIGEVIANPVIEMHWHNEKLAEIAPQKVVDEAPVYERPFVEWTPKNRVDSPASWPHKTYKNSSELLEVLNSAMGGGRNWVFQQYDQRVGGKTVRDAESSVGVIRLPDSGRALGVVLGCRPHVMRFDAEVGGQDAVAYPALELAAKGFLPLAVTDCLNFGNPEKPHVMGEFVAAVEAMSEQCRALNAPVISGNVSLYNETLGENITSTPSTGVVGLCDSVSDIPRDQFVNEGDKVYLLQLNQLTLNGLRAENKGDALQGFGQLNASQLADAVDELRQLVLKGTISASRVVGKFGLGYALSRMCLGGWGCEVNTSLPLAEERLYEVVVTGKEPLPPLDIWTSTELGFVAGSQLKVNSVLECPIEDLKKAYMGSWEKHFANLA